MPIKFLDKKNYLVQVQRAGQRRTRRGTGNEATAKRVEEELLAELAHELKVGAAADLLGVDRAKAEAAPMPTLREFFERRWVEHARVVQNESTRRAQRTPFAYLLFYLGDRPLDALLRRVEVNGLVEALKRDGPLTFATRKDGAPFARRTGELKHVTVNKVIACLKALLNLAHAEDVLAEPPKFDLLPQDDSVPVVPPTEDEYRRLLAACEQFREVAPLLPEVVEFAAETGLRRAEVFHLTWGSVDLARDAVRIEMQAKGRLVNGRAWRPKHNKWREVPLSGRARAILEGRLAAGSLPPDEPVFPNRGGCPYVRMAGAGKDAGSGWFPAAVEAAGLRGKVTFHGLRHLFAVRLLTRGVPITVASELLGHSKIELTVKRYGRFASDARVKWDAVRVLDTTASAPVPPPLVALPGGLTAVAERA
jgi:integrase